MGRLLHPHRHAAAPAGGLQRVVGEPGQPAQRRRIPGPVRDRRSGVLEPEPDLRAHLKMGHAAVLATHRGYSLSSAALAPVGVDADSAWVSGKWQAAMWPG